MFWQNEDFSDQITLDGVICVVDAVFGLKVSRLIMSFFSPGMLNVMV